MYQQVYNGLQHMSTKTNLNRIVLIDTIGSTPVTMNFTNGSFSYTINGINIDLKQTFSHVYIEVIGSNDVYYTLDPEIDLSTYTLGNDIQGISYIKSGTSKEELAQIGYISLRANANTKVLLMFKKLGGNI